MYTCNHEFFHRIFFYHCLRTHIIYVHAHTYQKEILPVPKNRLTRVNLLLIVFINNYLILY